MFFYTPIGFRRRAAFSQPFGTVFILALIGTSPVVAQDCTSQNATYCYVNDDRVWSGPELVWSHRNNINLGTDNGSIPTLTIESGAEVSAANAIQIGNAQNSSASIVVSGDGTVLQTGRIGIGSLNNAQGSLIVQNNGVVRVTNILNSAFNENNTASIDVLTGGRIEVSGNAFIGREGTANATVDGHNSTFDIVDALYVGRFATGNGTLNVENGGFVSAAAASLGMAGTGTVNVTGAGSRFATVGVTQIGGALDAANGTGTGTLTVGNGGTVITDSISFAVGTGTLNIDGGGVVETGQVIGIGGTSAVNFDGGTLRLTGDQSQLFTGITAGNITLNAAGGIFDTQGFDVSVAGGIGGAGALVKTGSGTLRFMLPQNYTGDTVVSEGILAAGAANVFGASANHLVEPNGILHTGDFNQTVQSVQNAGRISLSGGVAGDVLTVTGDYQGDGGVLELDTVLGNDSSVTDKLSIQGNSAGTGLVRINNAGGIGAQTNEGIRIIEVAGESAGSFSLVGDYAHQGEQAVVSGAYAYKLYHGGKSTPGDGDWYLRSEMITGGLEPEPLYQAGTSVYESYPHLLLGLNGLPTLRQRVGNRFWASTGGSAAVAGTAVAGSQISAQHSGLWGRIEGVHNNITPRFSTTGTDFDYNAFKLQVGLDGPLAKNENGLLIGGAALHYAYGSARIRSPYDAANGGGRIGTDGFGFAGTLTWYEENGFYLDGQGQVTWYNSDLSFNGGSQSLIRGNDGFGYASSIEGGKRIDLDSVWSFTPQTQLVYSNVGFDDFNDAFGARVGLDRGESLQARLGITLDHKNTWQNASGTLDRTHVYGIANLYYEFLNGTQVDVAGTSFASEKDRLWVGPGLGGSYSWDDDRYSIYGEGVVNTSVNNFGDSHALTGTVGFRVRW